ncbi:toxin C-terminal domain-containing protein [Myroides sp. TSA_177.3]|uniref:toxin C-terminal domain-containing protein n=1 Tax=Myroides sp. TSA_177.3 TaxID=3415650 RepID=UPI004045D0BF
MIAGGISSGGAFDVFGLKEAFWNFLSGNDNVPYNFKLGAADFKGGGKTDFNVPKGFKLTKEFGKSHGQAVYKKGQYYYSRDIDSHNGGVWKVFEAKGKHLHSIGAADENLKNFKG